jgi:hypothetical protein
LGKSEPAIRRRRLEERLRAERSRVVVAIGAS